MKFHNLMEDIVFKFLDEMLEEKKDICKCEQCMNDIMCYTLNRIKPMYIISARGIIHTENENRYQFQNEIDVLTTLNEAIGVISAKRRHDIAKNVSVLKKKTKEILNDNLSADDYYFNFPQLVGRVFDSLTLTPLSDAKISLFDESGKVLIKMLNDNWLNPFQMIDEMKGSYTFWASPLKTSKAGIQKDFQMALTVTKDDYEPSSKFFFVRTVSQKGFINYISKSNTLYIDDIYISKGSRRGGR